MPVTLVNNAVSRLASSLSSGSTSLSVTAGEGGKFPSPAVGDWFPLTIVKASGALEILRCTARSGDVFTVVRAQEATAAQSFSAGDRVELRFTAAAFADLVAALNALKNSLGTASVKNAQATATDATAGVLMMLGAFGLGAELVSTEANMNNYVVPGSYVTPSTGLTSMPVGAVTTERHLIIVSGGANYVSQILIATSGGNAWFRSAATAGIGAAPWRKIIHADNLETVDPWALQPIGVPIPMLYETAAPPTNKAYRYIRLTASDSYNTGVLTGEAVSGSGPLVVATANISLAGSVLNGASVSLINSERSSLRAGSVRVKQNDALQNITGIISGQAVAVNSSTGYLVGAFEVNGRSTSRTSPVSAAGYDVSFDASRVARTDVETRSKNIGVTYYMRIK